MPIIEVGAKCVICEKDLRREVDKVQYGHYTAQLSQLIFCDDCRKGLKELICGRGKEDA